MIIIFNYFFHHILISFAWQSFDVFIQSHQKFSLKCSWLKSSASAAASFVRNWIMGKRLISWHLLQVFQSSPLFHFFNFFFFSFQWWRLTTNIMFHSSRLFMDWVKSWRKRLYNDSRWERQVNEGKKCVLNYSSMKCPKLVMTTFSCELKITTSVSRRRQTGNIGNENVKSAHKLNKLTIIDPTNDIIIIPANHVFSPSSSNHKIEVFICVLTPFQQVTSNDENS